jgi:hypothetical protein
VYVHTCMSESRLVLSLSLALPPPPPTASIQLSPFTACLSAFAAFAAFAALPLHISASPCSRSLCDIRPKVPAAFCVLVLVGHVTLPAPHASSLSVRLFLFSSAPAGVYTSRYSSRRQAPRLRTLPLLFLQFKPNVATYSQAVPRLH